MNPNDWMALRNLAILLVLLTVLFLLANAYVAGKNKYKHKPTRDEYRKMVKYAKDMLSLGVTIEPETPYIWADYFWVSVDDMLKAIREARRELKQ